MLHRGTWEINLIEYLVFIWSDEKDKSLRIWDVLEKTPKPNIESGSKPEPRKASIMATEKFQDRTLIEFIDGASSSGLRMGFKENHPIGDDFISIMNEVVSEWKDNSTEELIEEPQTRELNDWFDYLHKIEHRSKVPMKYIAEKTSYSINTIYKEHTLYMREHGITKKVRKSKTFTSFV